LPANVAQRDAGKLASVAVQLAYRGTFVIGPPFSQVPPFTLLDDGTMIGATDDGPVYTAKLSHDEVERIVKHVRDLGFDRLESHTDSCQRHGNVAECASDASFTILRVARPDGTLREVSTYAGFSNLPEVHDRIVEYLSTYRPARSTPYRPTSGVLHVRVERGPATAPCPAIDPAILHVADRSAWAFAIDGPSLAELLAISPVNPRSFVACVGDTTFHLAFIPAVPGVDLSSELEPYKRQ
jgi:hypothetical protein